MVSFHESEDIGFVSWAKMLTFRAFDSKVHKLLGTYEYKHGLFDFVSLGTYLVIGIEETPMTLTESEAIALGFESKEQYFSHNFNGFNCDDDSKMIQKVSFINLDAVYGIFDELDNWIDELEEAKLHKFADDLAKASKLTDARMIDGSILTVANSSL